MTRSNIYHLRLYMNNTDIQSKFKFTKLKYAVDRAMKYPIGDGDHGSISPNDYMEEGVPYIRVQNLTFKGKFNNKGLVFISEQTHRKNLKSKILPNDILIAKTGTVGKICLVPDSWEEYNTTSSVGKISLDTKRFEPKYILYYLQFDYIQNLIKEISYQKSAQPGFNIDDLVEFPILEPNLFEQRLIIQYLDKKTEKIDNLIEKTQKKIEFLKEYQISFINKYITKGLNKNLEMRQSGIEWIGETPKHWKIKKIKHISIVKRGSSPRPIDNPKYFDNNGEYSWVRISDVSASGKYLEVTKQKLSELGSSLSTKMKIGDIFLSIAGSVGKPIISNIKCCIHDGFVWFEDLKVNADFLFYVFLQGTCFQGLGKLGTQLNLNTDTVGDIYLPMPDHDEQLKIVIRLEKKFNQIQKCLDLETLRLKHLEEYRQSLISSVVTGKIRINNDMI